MKCFLSLWSETDQSKQLVPIAFARQVTPDYNLFIECNHKGKFSQITGKLYYKKMDHGKT